MRTPQGWSVLAGDRLERLKAQAATHNVPFTNDEAVDIVNAGITALRRHSDDGKTHFRLTPRLTSYHVWAATSARLDDPLTPSERATIPGEGETLRARFGKRPARLEDVGSLPVPAKVGVGVVVVTNDGQMVLGLRGKTFVASLFDGLFEEGQAPVHFVAEGMMPTDLDVQGRLSPEETAKRGLFEEMGIEVGQLLSSRGLSQTGVFFDTQRWQPCFAYIAHVDVSFDELLTQVVSADDYWEADQLIPVPFDPLSQMTRDLLFEVDARYRFASNHAQALAYFALLHEYGLRSMQDAMRFPPRRRRRDRDRETPGIAVSG